MTVMGAKTVMTSYYASSIIKLCRILMEALPARVFPVQSLNKNLYKFLTEFWKWKPTTHAAPEE